MLFAPLLGPRAGAGRRFEERPLHSQRRNRYLPRACWAAASDNLSLSCRVDTRQPLIVILWRGRACGAAGPSFGAAGQSQPKPI